MTYRATYTFETPFQDEINYVIFANEVVQYYNDDMRDFNGVRSTLYQYIADELFKTRPDTHYCTEKKGDE